MPYAQTTLLAHQLNARMSLQARMDFAAGIEHYGPDSDLDEWLPLPAVEPRPKLRLVRRPPETSDPAATVWLAKVMLAQLPAEDPRLVAARRAAVLAELVDRQVEVVA